MTKRLEVWLQLQLLGVFFQRASLSTRSEIVTDVPCSLGSVNTVGDIVAVSASLGSCHRGPPYYSRPHPTESSGYRVFRAILRYSATSFHKLENGFRCAVRSGGDKTTTPNARHPIKPRRACLLEILPRHLSRERITSKKAMNPPSHFLFTTGHFCSGRYQETETYYCRLHT